MLVYFDTSALLKRVLAEDHSSDLVAYTRQAHARGDDLVTSTLTSIEVERALRAVAARGGIPDGQAITEATSVALSGMGELPLSAPVTRLARWIGNNRLRTLDAIHLASAIANVCDQIVTYDDRLLEAAQSIGMPGVSPSSD